MNDKQDIINIKPNGDWHGYNVLYQLSTGEIIIRGFYKDHKDIGYEEYHTGKQTTFYIK